MTKLYIYPDDDYERKPESGDTISGRFYESLEAMIEGEGLEDDDGYEYTVILIDTDDFKKITIHSAKPTFDEKPLYPAKKSKGGKK